MVLRESVTNAQLVAPSIETVLVMGVQLARGDRLEDDSIANDIEEIGQLNLRLFVEIQLMFIVGGWGVVVTVKSNRS